MARRRVPDAPPVGRDDILPAGRVRQGMWMVDPETGEWACVKQFSRNGFRCTGFGKVRENPVLVSLHRLGGREFDPTEPITVRVSDTD